MRIFKNIFAVLTVFIVLTVTAFATDVYIDGEKVAYDDTTGHPFTEDGNILVPLYPTFEAFGNDGIFQDNPNGTVVITVGGISVSCNTTDNNFCRNGTVIPGNVGLVWKGGPLYVPVEIFSAFDAEVSVSGSGVIITRPSRTEGRIGIFGASYDENYRGAKYFGVKYEPVNGLYLGCIPDDDPVDAVKHFGEVFRKESAAFTVFADPDDTVAKHKNALKYAAESGKLVRYVITFNENEGMDTETLTKLASELEASGARILLCPVFGGECDGIRKNVDDSADDFMTLSGIFRTNAPSVAMVWQICSCCAEDFISLYPGDGYIDYVEVSLCESGHISGTEMLRITAACSYKKPLILSMDECAIPWNDESIAKSFLGFCTYLPVKYPQVKAVFFPIPDDQNEKKGEYINILRSGTAGISYLESPNLVPDNLPYYFELGNNVTVPPSKIKLYSGFDTEHTGISYVAYKLNGENVGDGTIKSMPYEVEADFSSFAGKTVSLQAIAYDSSNKPFAQRTYILNVSTKQSADNSIAPEKTVHPAVYIVIIVTGIVGILIILKKINDIFC